MSLHPPRMRDPSNGYDAIAAEFIPARGTRSAVGVRTVGEWATTVRAGGAVLDLGCGPGDPITRVLVTSGLGTAAAALLLFEVRPPVNSALSGHGVRHQVGIAVTSGRSSEHALEPSMSPRPFSEVRGAILRGDTGIIEGARLARRSSRRRLHGSCVIG